MPTNENDKDTSRTDVDSRNTTPFAMIGVEESSPGHVRQREKVGGGGVPPETIVHTSKPPEPRALGYQYSFKGYCCVLVGAVPPSLVKSLSNTKHIHTPLRSVDARSPHVLEHPEGLLPQARVRAGLERHDVAALPRLYPPRAHLVHEGHGVLPLPGFPARPERRNGSMIQHDLV